MKGTKMQYTVDTQINEGHLELSNLPFEDGSAVKVVLIPKASLSKMLFQKAQELTKNIEGNLSDDITDERAEK